MTQEDSDVVSTEAVLWAFRYFIGREPADDQEIAFHRQHGNLESLRTAFAQTREFADYLRNLRKPRTYCIPMFLIQPPVDPTVHWRFAPPRLAEPVSQMCTGSQFEEGTFGDWCAAMDIPRAIHRKVWEFCFVLAALDAGGMLKVGNRGLGFGVGQEPLPALLAQRGLTITATDAPMDVEAAQGWGCSGQHASGLEAMDRPTVLPFERLRERVAFRFVDMNVIPDDISGYDFCWSSCALEHLGSLEHGLRFVQESLRTLRPGGYAVHTTELNLSSNEATLEHPSLSLYRKKDIEAVAARLVAAGHHVSPLNFHPGDTLVDEYIDLPPYASPHLKLELDQYVTTSFGLVVRKGDSGA
ncbi:MAG: hypothetical protein AB7U95_07190 [Reyranella sp.]